MKSDLLLNAALFALVLGTIIFLGIDIYKLAVPSGDPSQQLLFFRPVSLGILAAICICSKRYMDRELAKARDIDDRS